jgi:ribosomal protein S18 acetylase RimI-like enzyme
VPLALRRVRDDELADWAQASYDFYVTDLVAHAGMSQDAAEAKARADQADALAGKPPSPGHHLFFIEEDGAVVGRLWFAEREVGIWLYQIDIDDEQRGRGLGREAMDLFEEKVRELGGSEVWLNVHGGNDVARSLYRSRGYGEVSVHMSKKL